jgi:hypothetical protein
MASIRNIRVDGITNADGRNFQWFDNLLQPSSKYSKEGVDDALYDAGAINGTHVGDNEASKLGKLGIGSL